MTLIHEPDLGTPAVANDHDVTLTIDGRAVTVPEGTSVLRAARGAGIDIPKLCASDNLAAYGSCRLCLVEVEGAKGTPASCIFLTLVTKSMPRSFRKVVSHWAISPLSAYRLPKRRKGLRSSTLPGVSLTPSSSPK